MIEDYFEGELGEPATSLVTAHLAGCEKCAKLHNQLRREQEIYVGFLGDIKESPSLWSAVRSGIEREQAVTPVPRHPFWRSGLFRKPQLGMAFALALIILVLGIGLMRYVWTSPGGSPNVAVTSNPETSLPGKAPDSASPASTGNASSPIARPNPSNPSAKPTERGSANGKQLLARRSERNRLSDLSSRSVSPLLSATEELMASNAETIKAFQQRWQSTSLLDGEIARHLQESQLMLRSVRNATDGDEVSTTSAISYERGLSRELLNKNILLRRNAAARGDVLAENVLSRLEPFLLDVANIQDKPSAVDLRLLRERIRRNQIIVTLRAYAG